MKSKAFNIAILLCLGWLSGTAQYRLTGKVISAEDSSVVKDCFVRLGNGNVSAITDSFGMFSFADVAKGTYTLHFIESSYKYSSLDVTVSTDGQKVTIALQPRSEVLEEVVVSDNRDGFGSTHLRAIENMGIYEGKKTEVIVPDQLVANVSTNNARQVYARVPGLNIWENDGAGLQLSIGGRGLDPNRTSNFNVRQNGYDISADALGYPESYYTPPIEAVGRIQIVRGAASLQYGTQFGGLINFNLKEPAQDKKLELVARQTLGSFGFYNTFTSASGTVNKLSYYTFFQYKTGNGWRKNSDFDNRTFYGRLAYAITDKTKVSFDYTHMSYLAHQPGGLTDEMFAKDPRQSNRERNWFEVGWNLFALHLDQKITATSDFNLRVFGLMANRYSVGFRPNRVATVDDNGPRDLIRGEFQNWGAEARYLNRYNLAGKPSALLVGMRYYHGYNHSQQGEGSTGSDADFSFVNPERFITYDYQFPNRNAALFAENVLYLHEKLSITPGIRFEYINTKSDGYYGTIYRDLAGNVLDITRTDETRADARQFVLGGIGISFKPTEHIDVYTNISQNYRSITFNDMRISNPSSTVDPNLKDERGYSIDLGVRSEQTTFFNYDIGVFIMNYDNRIGEVQYYDELNRVMRRRGNIGQAIIAGIESYALADIVHLLQPDEERWTAAVFGNIALIKSKYVHSEAPGIAGNKVEFVPDVNVKGGLQVAYRKLKASYQVTHLSEQFSDATNATDGGVSAVVGIIPSYTIMDLSLSYEYKMFKLEGSVNNLANKMYFTRRATGYPGPGILPSDGRSVYVTLQVKL
jgi:Fe(3+) dicitrate transport protein